MKKKHTHHPILTVTLTIALMAVVCLLLFFSSTEKYIQRLSDSIENSVEAEYERVSTLREMEDIYVKQVKLNSTFYIEYAAYYLDKFGFNNDTLNFLGEMLNRVNLYYIEMDFATGKVRDIHKAYDAYELNLNYDELQALCLEGSLDKESEQGDVKHFQSKKIKGDYVIMSYYDVPLEDIGVVLERVSPSYTGETIMWLDLNRLTITDSSDESILGESIEAIFGPNKATKDEKYLITNFRDMGRCLIVYKVVDGEAVVAAVPIGNVIADGIRNALVPALLFVVILLLVMGFVLSIRKSRTHEELIENRTVLLFGINIDKYIFSYIVTLTLFGAILLVISTIYSHALITYSDQNMQAEERLDELEAEMRVKDQNSAIMISDSQTDFEDCARNLARGLLKNPITVDDSALNELNTRLSTVDSITVFDTTGSVVASTNMEDGYTIGRKEGASDSEIWDIIDGKEDIVFYTRVDSYGDNYYVVAVKRQDKNGVIKMEISAPWLDGFLAKNSVERSMLLADFGEADIIYIDKKTPDSMLIRKSGSLEVEKRTNTLSDEVLENGYTGVKLFDRKSYYINNLVIDNAVLISAVPVIKFGYSNTIISVVILLLGLLAFAAIMIFGTSFRLKKNEADTVALNGPSGLFRRESISERLVDEKFKKIIKYLIIITGVLVVGIMIADMVISKHSIISYLIGNNWNKGVNLLSITVAILICVIAFVVSYFLRLLIKLICNGMGPRGLTIGHLMDSLLRFIIFIISIIFILAQFGCNITALITSASILGAAISVCANSTVNDLLSGFFIVFEGTFQIGDWVRVGDFRGQVQEIGMRTTKIAYGDCIRVMNNSSLTNVTLMDRLNSGSLIQIEVAYGEDIDRVIAIINENRPRYAAEIPRIEEGPFVKGVTGLGSNGVMIELYAFAPQAYSCSIERDVRRITKRIFDENGIEIPFNQVTIHQGK